MDDEPEVYEWLLLNTYKSHVYVRSGFVTSTERDELGWRRGHTKVMNLCLLSV